MFCDSLSIDVTKDKDIKVEIDLDENSSKHIISHSKKISKASKDKNDNVEKDTDENF